VREHRDPGARLPYRLWYEEAEIESICSAELAQAGTPRLRGGWAVDVDRFVEFQLGVVPEFSWLPRGVLGATEFTPAGEVRLRISAELSLRAEEERAAARLLRSTLAHEAAHVLLHRILFLRESEALFGPGVTERSELCREVSFTRPGYQGEWWEWQANRGMAALLLPAAELLEFLARWKAEHPEQRTAGADEAVAAAFDVGVESVRRRRAQLRALR
jgi:hypothetical protein